MIGEGDASAEEAGDPDLALCLPLDGTPCGRGRERDDGAPCPSSELSSSDDDEVLPGFDAFSDERPCAWRLVVGICVSMESFPN